MKNVLVALFLLGSSAAITAQQVAYEEYDLDNGLHVILHQDNGAPVVVTSVMYHIGSKVENKEKTGFAHFFEHLLFEGTENIQRGDFFKIVTANGGYNNANTTQDRTYYYELFPSNNLELGLWLESERMLHPVITQIGVDTQKEVVQEERRSRVDNAPYGQLIENMFKNMFINHPYRWSVIGSLDHLASATIKDFQEFNKVYHIPNNAVLVVAGDFEMSEAKRLIKEYFEPIPKGQNIVKKTYEESPIQGPIQTQFEDPNIQIPLILLGYRTPGQAEKDAYVLNMISSYLSDGESSVLQKKLVDEKRMALQIFAFNYSLEDYGAYLLGGLPLGSNTMDDLVTEVDEEIEKLKTELISERDYQKLQNQFENSFVNSNSSVEGIANSLANNYMLFGKTDLINTEIDIYRSISREDIREVARKYLNADQRVELKYIPKQN
ncbi:MAG: pitrilysin family protein [Bacteroidetes bacterium]|nr:pitrilysin family protein [Bacteroidota bacterium]